MWYTGRDVGSGGLVVVVLNLARTGPAVVKYRGSGPADGLVSSTSVQGLSAMLLDACSPFNQIWIKEMFANNIFFRII